MTDLFLPADGRLRDDDRATIARLLAGMVDRGRARPARAARRDVRRSADAGRIAALAAHRDRLADRSSGPADCAMPALVRALARRSEAGRAGGDARPRARAIARTRAAERACRRSTRWPMIAIPAIAAAAGRLIAAERRRWGAGRRADPRTAELPAETYHRLVWRVAAALRGYIVDSGAVTPAEADPAIARGGRGARWPAMTRATRCPRLRARAGARAGRGGAAGRRR